MNKVILLGRLTKDPEIRISKSGTTLAMFTLAVNRKFKKDGEPNADFINCLAFGEKANFFEKYIKKGQQIAIIGRISVNSWDDKSGERHYAANVIVEEQYFAESKNLNAEESGLYPVYDNDTDLPF
nr:MAG TPA: Single strand binding protein [Caudoviricetes sp.]